jgi:hypothetical protein
VLLLALRMTASEQLRETLNQLAGRLALPAAEQPVIVGPAIIAGQSAVALLVAAGASVLAAMQGSSQGMFPRRRAGQAVLLAAVFACGIVSMLGAANRFAAAVGLADLGTALAAGYAVAVLLPMLGQRGRRALVAGLLAIFAVWVAKGYLQEFVEFPETEAFVREHQEEVLRSQGIFNDEVQTKLFLTRMASREVHGYLAFSNVFAAGLVGLLTIATATLVAAFKAWPRALPSVQKKEGEPRQVSAAALGLVALCVLTIAGFVLLPMTGSQGGTLLGVATPLAIAVGGFAWRQVVAWRRLLVGLCVAGLLVGTAGVLFYGLRHDALPSKSLMFRWHYWTASAPIIREHPAWGVGLNNFGDYYLQFKRPSSPEDVKDPHNFFVRLASEMGVPAAVLVGAIAVWMLAGALRRAHEERDDEETTDMPAFALAGVTALLWVVLHLLFYEAAIEFNVYITVFWAILAFGVFAAGMATLRPREGAGRFPVQGYLAAAAGVAALAMLAYDQINMALVTGPLAMMFWMVLGFCDSGDVAAAATATHQPARWAWVPAGTFGAAAVAVLTGLWIPLLNGSMPWDPSPHEEAVIRALEANRPDVARAAMAAAIERSPRSLELRMKELTLLREYFPNEPRADKIRAAAALDRANARVAYDLARTPSDLPAPERLKLLQEALERNALLPAEEYKRLTPEQLGEIERLMGQLRAGATQPQ